MASPELEQQQEKLRRAVDEWRCRSHELLVDLRCDPYVSSFSSPAAAAAAAAAGSRSSSADPIRLHVWPLEHSDLPSLLESDNVDVAKFVTVLSYDCSEISRLCQYASRNLYRQLLLFGHRSSSQEILLEGEPQKAFGRSLSLFMELYEIMSRMTVVLRNLLQQLDSIYSQQDKNGRPYQSFKNVSLRSIFASLGEGLSMFLVLDEILKQNGHVRGYLSLFARMLSKVKLELDTFGITVEDVDCLDQVVCQLEKLLDNGLFQGISSLSVTLQKVRSNRKLIDACTSCIHDGLLEILARLDTWKEYPFDRRKLLHHVALFLFLSHTFEFPEKKLGKVIVEMLQVIPLVYVEGDIQFMILDLINSQSPHLLSSWSTLRDAAKEHDAMKKNYLTRLHEMHSRDWQAIKDALSCWVVSFQSTVYPVRELSKSDAGLRLQLKLIIQGILLTSRMRILALSMLDLHALLEVPVRKEKFKSLCHAIILLKLVANTFHNKILEIIQSLPHIINLIQADMEQFLVPAKVQLHSEVNKGGQVSKMRFLSSLTHGGKDTDTRLTDSLSLVLISLQLLQGGGSFKRQLVLSITLDVIQSIGHLDIDFLRIKKLLSKLSIIVDFQNIVEEVTNCSFLYWRKETIGDWFSLIYMDVNKFSWLQYLLDAFCDGLWLLNLGHVGNLTQQSYEKEIENAMRNEIIVPLCRDIENDLRLHVHSTHLKGSVHVNPTKTGVRNLSWYLEMKPLRLPYKFIDVRILVESYLNSVFYNHTVMSSYNWKTYTEMRQLAELKYGLLLDDVHLPEHSAGHGFDLTEIVKDVCSFAKNYSYSIVKQIFIEKVSNGQGRKTITVVGVEHVASAIATLGLTTLNIADNVIQFLTQNIAMLSRLLQDNLVRSLLAKEKFWKNDKGTINKYPFLRTEQRSVTVGKHSIGDHKANIADHLRSIITEMGNALGLMRILLAGCSRHSWRISSFICKPRNVTSFMESCQKLGFTDRIDTAVKVMDIAMENKYQSVYDTDYFSLLVSAISKELQSNESLDLRDFFLLIPALIISLIDSKIHFKEKSLRRDREPGNQITADDGFIIGVAYILKVTGQDKSFDKLQWFASANKHFEEAMLCLDNHSRRLDQQKGSKIFGLKLWNQAPTSISPEVQKGVDQLKRQQKEMRLIEYAFNIARTIMS